MRKQAVRRKLNAMHSEFEGKHVMLVDDSIVRGTTSREIIIMAREAGAKKVTFASCSPPIKHPNVYGIDMPSVEELVAHNRTQEEIAAEIGADAVIYLVPNPPPIFFFLRRLSLCHHSLATGKSHSCLSDLQPKYHAL